MKWLAILLAMAGLGGQPTREASHSKPKCTTSKSVKHKKACKKKPTTKKPTTNKPVTGGTPTSPTTPGAARPQDPDATPTPTPTATPKPGQPTPTATPTSTPTTPTPTPTATPVYPRRTAVDLLEWDIRSSYLTLGAGRVTFNANNLGEDDHNLSVRGGGKEWDSVDLGPGDTKPLVLELPAGNYTLYCSLIGHEEAGMKLSISVR